jgi:hypothetical protein
MLARNNYEIAHHAANRAASRQSVTVMIVCVALGYRNNFDSGDDGSGSVKNSER